jgi:Methyltransferase domain
VTPAAGSAPPRYVADLCGGNVTAVHLTGEYCQTANWLNGLVGLDEQISVRQADITDLPFPDGSFDVVFSQHVQMNVADKDSLHSEARRVLVAGGRLAYGTSLSASAANLTIHCHGPTTRTQPLGHVRPVTRCHRILGVRDRALERSQRPGRPMMQTLLTLPPNPLGLHTFVTELRRESQEPHCSPGRGTAPSYPRHRTSNQRPTTSSLAVSPQHCGQTRTNWAYGLTNDTRILEASAREKPPAAKPSGTTHPRLSGSAHRGREDQEQEGAMPNALPRPRDLPRPSTAPKGCENRCLRKPAPLGVSGLCVILRASGYWPQLKQPTPGAQPPPPQGPPEPHAPWAVQPPPPRGPPEPHVPSAVQPLPPLALPPPQAPLAQPLPPGSWGAN